MELYHVLNRGVDKREIFLNDRDRLRFVNNLYDFNDENRVINTSRSFQKLSDIGCPSDRRDSRKLLVDIHVFSLMPNHYHLLLSPKVKDGIPKFMQKMNMGYAKYFNEKYKRSGALFQGKYKSIAIKRESYFIHLPYYIHLNPLDLNSPEWRVGKLDNPSKALNFLENYRWSSFLDYIGKSNFPSITFRSFISGFHGGSKNYKNKILKELKEMNYGGIDTLNLEGE